MSNGFRSAVFLNLVLTSAVVFGDDDREITISSLNSAVATFATGEWAAERPNACPVMLHPNAPKVAVYTRHMNAGVLRLAQAVDGVVANDTALRWSYLFVSHENDPTPSPEEWDTQFTEIGQMASDYELEHLAVGLMLRIPESDEPIRVRRNLGIFHDGDVVLAWIVPTADGRRGTIGYCRVLDSAQLDDNLVDEVIRDLRETMATDSSTP